MGPFLRFRFKHRATIVCVTRCRVYLRMNSSWTVQASTLPVLLKQRYDYSEEPMSEDELYRHTRYRFLSNDSENLAVRYLKFNLPELINVAIKAAGNGAKSCTKLLKCLEGQFNKAFILTMDNGTEVLAKLPNPNAGPKFFTTASEVATREFIYKRLRLPIAKIYAYSSNPDNPVGAEYIIEEKVGGIPLARVWYNWPKESKLALVAQLVDFEAQLMSICFQKHGCIYYKKDLEEKGLTPQALEARVLLPTGPSETLSSTDEFAFGPLSRTILWQSERSTLDLERGPWIDLSRYMTSMGRNEILWAATHTEPRINCFNALEQPETYIKLLHRYMDIVPRIMPPLMWTSLSHPDLHLGNIFVDPDTRQITGVIDWQSISVCEPYFQCDIPRMLALTGQKFTEPASSPKEFPCGSEEGKTLINEEELLHYYQQLSQQKNPQRWEALNFPFRKVIVAPTKAVSGAWENFDLYSLRDSLITIVSVWPHMARRSRHPCPIQFTENELEDHDNESEIVEALSTIIHQLHNDNLIPLGGMVYAERYEHVVAANKECHKLFVEMAETEDQKQVALRLWPYQDRK